MFGKFQSNMETFLICALLIGRFVKPTSLDKWTPTVSPTVSLVQNMSFPCSPTYHFTTHPKPKEIVLFRPLATQISKSSHDPKKGIIPQFSIYHPVPSFESHFLLVPNSPNSPKSISQRAIEATTAETTATPQASPRGVERVAEEGTVERVLTVLESVSLTGIKTKPKSKSECENGKAGIEEEWKEKKLTGKFWCRFGLARVGRVGPEGLFAVGAVLSRREVD